MAAHPLQFVCLTCAQFEKTPKASVQERKIRVSWLSAEEGASVEEGDTNGLVGYLTAPLLLS